jgi:prepilin-type N-terminal cleavage/methylation domain-containing protein
MTKRSRSQTRFHPCKAADGIGGFTLVEVLATLVLLGAVLPVTMRGMSIAMSAASTARHMSEAATLGQAKLNELLVAGEWSTTGDSGDFGDAWPQYRWATSIQAGSDYDLYQVSIVVTWNERGQERTLALTTLAPVPP